MNESLKSPDLALLFRAILALENEADCDAFFEDLCTVQELAALSQRIRVAQMLSQQCVYSEIVAATGASTATISRVNRALRYGRAGYRSVLARLAQKESATDEL